MSSKRYKPKGFRPWESSTPGKPEGFSPLTHSLIDNPKFRKLSPEAVKIYLYMMRAANGKQDFIFPKSVWKDLCAPATFQSRKNELIQNGFIQEIENNSNTRKPNLYRLSDQWWKG